MIQLKNKDLDKEILDELERLQARIDAMPTFKERVAKAQALWNSKGGKDGKKAFETIAKELYDLCIYVGVCNYCEQSEANDIEHIYPKSFFPQTTFKWINYLLACKQCNSGFKLDTCEILDATNNLVTLKRGEEPVTDTIAFINPRVEDPNKFMVLNPLSHKFEVLPDLSVVDVRKAESTMRILELNTRDILLQARKSAGRYYYEALSRLIRILRAQTVEELEQALTPYDNRFDLHRSIKDVQDEIKESYKKHLTAYQHPSVWYSIKLIHSKTDPKWIALFAQIPEALNW